MSIKFADNFNYKLDSHLTEEEKGKREKTIQKILKETIEGRAEKIQAHYKENFKQENSSEETTGVNIEAEYIVHSDILDGTYRPDWYRYSAYKKEDGTSRIDIYVNRIMDAFDNLNEYYKDKEENSAVFKEVLEKYDEEYLWDYSLAGEIFEWILVEAEKIDLSSDVKKNEDAVKLLAAMKRFFAISYIEAKHGKEKTRWMIKFLYRQPERNAPISMYNYGDKLFEASINTIAGKRVKPREMSLYKNLLSDLKNGRYREGVNYLIENIGMEDQRYISREEYENYRVEYHPANLKRRTSDGKEEAITELEKNALMFIWEDSRMFKHAYPNIKDNEYSVDERLVCLYQAIHSFMETGSKYDAIDVYNCYCRSFLKGDQMQKFINMISSYENNASRLVQSHRDHYSHSVYVYILGLAVAHANRQYFNAFTTKHIGSFKLMDVENEKSLDLTYIDLGCGALTAEECFLKLWGLTALFHDIGYQYEIPFEQIKTTSDKKIIFNYLGFDDYTDFSKYVSDLEEQDAPDLWGKDARLHEDIEEYKKRLFLSDENAYKQDDCSIERIIAYHIVRGLSKDRGLTVDGVEDILLKKPTPNFNAPFMDHAYYSAIIMFKQLLKMFGPDELPMEFMDAIVAIVLHNKLFEFNFKGNVGSLKMEEHPLAYLLILCDELQCWDRTSFGKGSIEQLHAIDARFKFDNDKINVEYIFDERHIDKAFKFDVDGKINSVAGGTIGKFYKAGKELFTPAPFDKDDKSTYKVSSKDYSGCKCKFVDDIANIVDLDIDGEQNKEACITLTTEAVFGKKDKLLREYLSETSMRNLYDTAMNLYIKVSGGDEQSFEYAKLSEKLFYVDFVRNMGEALHSIGCFYTNDPKAFDIVDDISDMTAEEIGRMAGIEKIEMDNFCKANMLELKTEDDIKTLVTECTAILCESPGIEVYRL